MLGLTAIESQEKYTRLGALIGGVGVKRNQLIVLTGEIKNDEAEIKTLYAELGITNRRQRKIVERKQRKSRSDKGTKRDNPLPENEPEKTSEELEAEARATATCPICKKLLKDCICQISEEAAEKHKKTRVK